MNQVFAGGLALIIAFIFWNSKKNTKLSPFFKSYKNSLSNPQESSSLVLENKLTTNKKIGKLKNQKSKPFSIDPLAKSIKTKQTLNKLISSNPDDRLLAIEIADQWNNPKAIPFILKGLKDSDKRVVVAAAKAISSFKGKTIALRKTSQTSRPPRNVSLMR